MRFGLRDLSILAMFIAVVCVATVILKIDIPATRGFFNVGDSMVYVTALLFGPVIGGIAGGIGSSLADIILGIPWYAPGTLVVKGVEGLIVGYLGHKVLPRIETSIRWEMFSSFLGVSLGAIVCYLGLTYYVGIFGNFVIEKLFWVVVATLLGISIAYFGISRKSIVNWQIVSIICGGIEMIIGYYLYETLILPLIFPEWEIIAIVEVPFNIGQALIGLVMAMPIVKTVWNAIPSVRS
ncbi:MAG: ECF transporter S component [Candidatus Bathyarchaeota archaeon]|nr:ECF transporter S component [Candidatus Bathyarchaeota archaeon]MDH5623865.1 ECF transporter S component [Candidatus Bathyarchaeota archaeon]MDH5636214.1 ECF transporter S component [Candidatus Bathyarchaeota archaeon]MDH5701951.1 ECF transporter S component [Candidatus Bathyarchaeota archaeon]